MPRKRSRLREFEPEAFDLPIASKTFSRSEQLRRLLLYLRGVSGSDDPGVWSEMAIGASVFGRPDFNPKLDTIVRVEMRRSAAETGRVLCLGGRKPPIPAAVRKEFLQALPLPQYRSHGGARPC